MSFVSPDRRVLTLTLVGVLIAMGPACADLPTAESGDLSVEIVFDTPIEGVAGDTLVIRPRLRTREGEYIVGTPLRWSTSAVRGAQVTALGSEIPADSAAFLVDGAGSFTVTASVPSDDEIVAPATGSAEVTVGYGGVEFRFVDTPGDTTLTTLRPLALTTVGEDGRGRPLPMGALQVRSLPEGPLGPRDPATVLPDGTRQDVWNTPAPGTDTIIATSDLCLDPCADTLVVSIAPVVAGLGFTAGSLLAEALQDTIVLEAVWVDSAGFQTQIEPVPARWEFVEPEDTLVVRFLPDGLRLIAVSEGSARIRAVSEPWQADTVVVVDQVPRPSSDQFQGIGEVALLGAGRVVRASAEDRNGFPLSLAAEGLRWSSSDPTVLEIRQDFGDSIFVVPVQPGFARLDLAAHPPACPDPAGCRLAGRSRMVEVVEAVDSVWIIDGPGNPIPDEVAWPSGTSGWLARVFVPGFSRWRRQPIWESLEPQVATVDWMGRIRPISAGAARIVARVGDAADTVLVRINGEGFVKDR